MVFATTTMTDETSATEEIAVSVGEPVNHPIQLEPEPEPLVLDEPLLKRICSCESGTGRNGTPNHWELDGVTPLVGRITPTHLGQDIGMCQINTMYHLERANELGYDIYTPEGNWGYAKLLFRQLGTQPWLASKDCWQ